MALLVRALAVVAVVLLLMFMAPMLIGEKGYVLIALGQYTVEFSVVSLVFMLFVLAVGLYVIFKLLRTGTATLAGARNRFRLGRSSKQEAAFYEGLYALALGDKTQAKLKMEQARGNLFHGFNYLALGQLSLQNGDQGSAKHWFEKAEQSGDAQCRKATVLLQAQQLLNSGEPQQALSLLEKLEDSKDPQLVRIRAKAMADAENWQDLAAALPNWKKVLGDQFAHYNEKAAIHEFAEIASKQGANQLKEHWQNLPRKQRNDEAYQLAFLNQLIHQGMHQDAQTFIVKWYANKPLSNDVLELIKTLRLSQPASLIALLESAIKRKPNEATCYAALGHVAFHAGDNALSEKALAKAITLQETKPELLLLADLYARNLAYEQALQAMRRVNELPG